MPLVVPSIGTRLTDDQLVPMLLSEWLSTRSFVLQARRKRQSDQVTSTVPALSISAEDGRAVTDLAALERQFHARMLRASTTFSVTRKRSAPSIGTPRADIGRRSSTVAAWVLPSTHSTDLTRTPASTVYSAWVYCATLSKR